MGPEVSMNASAGVANTATTETLQSRMISWRRATAGQRLSRLWLCAVIGLGACAQPITQEQAGMVIGGVVGGIAGAQIGQGHGRTVATIVGTLAGAVIGGALGRTMDATDRLKTAHTLETVRTGVSSRWSNPDTGNQYTVTPTKTYDVSGSPCREYSIDAVIGGKIEKVFGTACRQSDGSWKVQS